MNSDELNQKIIDFFENIEKYYDSKTEITEGLFTDSATLDSKHITWNLSEFTNMYYEISAKNIIKLESSGRNKFEFTEQYAETVFRITKIRFHYKY
jgi:hypothetical protein